jgi:ribonuclease HI
MTRQQQFHDFRSRLNCRILGDEAQRGGKAGGTLVTKRFFTLDTKTYGDGKLPAKTKELLDWSPAWCCGATTAWRTTSTSA